MAEATVIMKYLGQPVTKAEVVVPPDWKRYEKLKSKAEKKGGLTNLPIHEFEELVRFTVNPPNQSFTTGREIVQTDEDGQVLRNFPKNEKGELVPKKALNGRAVFRPENDYEAAVTWDLSHQLTRLKSSTGHPLYVEVHEPKDKEKEELQALVAAYRAAGKQPAEVKDDSSAGAGKTEEEAG